MTKADIIKEIHHRTGIQRGTVINIVNELMTTIKADMAAGNNIYLRGFGTFSVKRYSAKRVYNINDGTYNEVPAHFVPTFKPGKELRNQQIQKKK